MQGTFIVRQGSIASVQYITFPDGKQITAIFQGPDPIPRQGITPIRVAYDRDVPVQVSAEVHRRFGGLFSLPYGARAEAIRMLQPVEITV